MADAPVTKLTTADVCAHVTDRMIELIEKGAAPWMRPWREDEAPSAPYNVITDRPYRGCNVITLAAQSEDSRWCTQKQAEKQGWHVRDGAVPELVIAYVPRRSADSDGRRGAFIMGYKVFNAADVDGVPAETQKNRLKPAWTTSERAERLMQHHGPQIRRGGGKAYYRWDEDRIQLPPKRSFDSRAGYYGTLLHEMGHWTGHDSRLHRKFGRWGDPLYAREELRAELASMILSIQLGVAHDPKNHAAYVASWLQALRDDPREILAAGSDAQKIADFLIPEEWRTEALASRTAPRRKNAATFTIGDLPQCDRFAIVRGGLAAFAAGRSSAGSGLPPRQLAYALHAAQILGFSNGAGADRRVEPAGQAFLRSREGSRRERELLAAAIRGSAFARSAIAADLLDAPGPSVAELVRRIEGVTGDRATSTVRRRAQCLIAWRRQLVASSGAGGVER